MPTGQTYDKNFKQEAVRLVKTSGKPQRQIANDLGVGISTLSRWCSELEEHGEKGIVNLATELNNVLTELHENKHHCSR